jgi:hypothetical protein
MTPAGRGPLPRLEVDATLVLLPRPMLWEQTREVAGVDRQDPPSVVASRPRARTRPSVGDRVMRKATLEESLDLGTDLRISRIEVDEKAMSPSVL